MIPLQLLKLIGKQYIVFLNNQKVPAIPPLLVNGEIISKFSEKASIFNKFFASHCTPLQNLGILPTFYLRTDETLSSLNISDDDIFASIKNLNPKKSYGWNNINQGVGWYLIKVRDAMVKKISMTYFCIINEKIAYMECVIQRSMFYSFYQFLSILLCNVDSALVSDLNAYL